MTSNHYDCIVAGAGIEGSAAAYNLAKNGKKTLLIEKFPLPHTRGSSHGMSRVMRKVFVENPAYIPIVQECFKLWYELQREVEDTLVRQTGLLWMGKKSENELKSSAEVMKQYDLPYELLSSTEMTKRYPQLKFTSDWMALYDPEATLIYANRCLNAFQNLFVKHGGVIHDGEPVVSVSPGQPVTVTTSKSTYTCDSVILCLGPWMKEFCKTLGLNLPLQVRAVKNFYWKAENPSLYASKQGFPLINVTDAVRGHFYSTPLEEYPGLWKFCWMEGTNIETPDMRDSISKEEVQKQLAAPTYHIKNHFAGLSEKPHIIENCMFTMTPDMTAILDHHPQHKNILIAAGFSGHGFKLAPLIGKMLAAMATGGRVGYNIESMKLSRFSSISKL